MEKDVLKLWMPLQKGCDGDFVGILSDNSIDRDGEFMSKKLLDTWVREKTALPMLANHENRLEKLIGGWTDKKLVSKGNNHAMVARPFFLDSNPLGRQAKAMVEEALTKGLGIGISIGAIPKGEMIEKEIDGEVFKGYTEAEILEATIVPIQSNRNASFSSMAKSFDIKHNDTEVTKMSEEEQGKPVGEVLAEAEAQAPAEEAAPVEEKKEEASVEEAPKEEAPAEEAPKEEAPAEPSEAEKKLQAELDVVKKKLKELEEKAVLKAKVEGPQEVKKDVEANFQNLLKQQYGGKL